MKTLHDIGLLFKRYAIQMLRDPVWLFVGLSTPVLYLVLFTPLLNHLALPGGPHGHAIDGFLPGILALQAFAGGAGPGFGTIFELKAGLTERLRVTPASRLALLLGPVLFSTVAMYFFDLLLVLVGMAFGFQARWEGLGILTLLLGLLMVSMASFSVALAIVTKEISAFASVVTGLNLPVLLLAGVLLPISLGPGWLKVLGHFNPLYYLVQAARQLAAGALATPATWQAFAVLVPLCVLTLAWATKVFRQAVA